MEEKKVSVIVPVYNGEQYIENCIQKIQDCDYQNLEILIVDDGSTDCTRDICERIARTNQNIRIFHKEHVGVSEARNEGMRNAQGDYIAFCDVDDYPEMDAYTAMATAFYEENVVLVCGGIYKKNGK